MLTLALLIVPAVAAYGAGPATQPAKVVTLSGSAVGRPLPTGFVGVSFEFRGLEEYLGSDPTALNPGFVQLIRNLAPFQHPVVRIGGDSTDWTWWPVPHLRSPGGVHYALSDGFGKVASALVSATGARLILGINLEANNRRVAAREANMMLRTIGARSISALEIGNEPDLYNVFPWYRTPAGQSIFGRPASYGPTAYMSEFANIASVVRGVPLAGPASGSPPYLAALGTLLKRQPRVRVVTIHAYPLARCNPAQVPTIAQLLAPQTISTLAANAAGPTAVAHRHGATLRVAELNAVTCGGYRPVTASFGAALWVLEQLFALDRVGVDGINMHTVPDIMQHLISARLSQGHWVTTVLPEYYGLLAFVQVAPPGSRLLTVSGPVPAGVEVDATTLRGQVRMALVNTNRSPRWLTLSADGLRGPLAAQLLTAPNLAAQGGVSLAGRTIDSATGALSGSARVRLLPATTVPRRVRVPGASALLLTPAPRGTGG